MPLAVGTEAPAFDAQDQHDRTVHSSDLAGQRFVLYFYPRDETMICTKEACAFQDAHNVFQELEIPVIGVSSDGVESHARFAKRHGLTFTLLADPEMTIIKAYDAKGLLGASRITYLVGPDGKIEGVYQNRLAGKGHVEWVQSKLEEIGATGAVTA